MTPVVTKTVLNKIIFNVWIENGPVLKYGPGIKLAFRSNSYVYTNKTEKSFSNLAASQFYYSRSNKSTTTLQF
jgi:hypothetical protein